MRLEDVKIEFKKDETKRIIRECNNGFRYISVWFTVKNNILMVNSWEFAPGGMCIHTRPAPFQTSEHTDWILID